MKDEIGRNREYNESHFLCQFVFQSKFFRSLINERNSRDSLSGILEAGIRLWSASLAIQAESTLSVFFMRYRFNISGIPNNYFHTVFKHFIDREPVITRGFAGNYLTSIIQNPVFQV